MKSVALFSIVALLAACVKSENSTMAADTGAAAVTPAPAPAAVPAAPAAAPISLKSVAGKYRVTSRGESGDTSVVMYDLDAMGDTVGWTITYPKQKPVPVRVLSVTADSIVTEAGPFTSVRRAGIPVTTHTTYRWENGQLVGRTVAHYKTTGADTMRVFILQGVKR